MVEQLASTALIERIRSFAVERKLKPATLARLAGLHANALREMYSEDWSPRFDTLQKLERLVENEQPRDAAE